MKCLVILLIGSTVFSSCYTYHIASTETKTFKNPATKPVAYITNPELKTAYQILQAAQIFELTNDSLHVQAIRITLSPMQKKLACGNPLAASMITLGQVPVYLPDTYLFQFNEQKGNQIIPRSFPLQIQTRYWFWDMFAFKKRFAQKVGQTLSANYYGQ
jgi:hypothetical protein